MMKQTRCISVTLLSTIAVLIVGCSGGQKKAATEDVTSKPVAREAVAVQSAQPKPAEPAEPAPAPVQPQATDTASEAQKKLTFAQNNMKMAEKGIMGYHQAVAICRSIIKDYPGTEEAKQAQELLQKIPEDKRAQYNLTNEELGIE